MTSEVLLKDVTYAIDLLTFLQDRNEANISKRFRFLFTKPSLDVIGSSGDSYM